MLSDQYKLLKSESKMVSRDDKPLESRYKIKLDLTNVGKSKQLHTEEQKQEQDNFDEQARQEFEQKDNEINDILKEIDVVLDEISYGAQNIGQVAWLPERKHQRDAVG